jgi:WD40 repeat protein
MEFEEIRRWLDDYVYSRTQHRLVPAEWIVLEFSWKNQSYQEMKDNGYSTRYLQQIVAPNLWRTLTQALGEPVGKRSLKTVLERHASQSFPASKKSDRPSSAQNLTLSHAHQWQQAPDTSMFYGRSQELQLLRQWIQSNRYRLITIFGLVGVGKSVLCKRLAESLQEEHLILWESVSTAPSLSQILTRLLRWLPPLTAIPDSLQSPLHQVIESLREHRCLIVLDGFESVLQARGEAGTYRAGYEDYGTFLEQVRATAHQSCVLITSRELPRELQRYPDYSYPFLLRGLLPEDRLPLFEHLYLDTGSSLLGEQLFDYYGRNPLMLQMAAVTIRNIYGGQIEAFLEDMCQGGVATPPDIRNALQSILSRVSLLEQEVLDWLAIAHVPLTLNHLQELLFSFQAKQQVPGTLNALLRRSLIDRQEQEFTLHPFLRNVLLRNLVDRSVQELTTGTPQLLNTHALMQATVPEYLRQTQRHRLLRPIVEQLTAVFGTRRSLEEQLQHLLITWRTRLHETPGYAMGNLINICGYVGVRLEQVDLSRLFIWQADLQRLPLAQVNLACSDMSNSIFAKSFGNQCVIALAPQGTQIAVGDERGYVQVWEVSTGRSVLSHGEEGAAILALQFSPEGQTLMSGDAQGAIRSWSLASSLGHLGEVPVYAQAYSYTRLEHQDAIRCLEFSPNGERWVSGSEDGSVRIWCSDTNQCVQRFNHPRGVLAIALSPDGQHLASLTEDHQVHLWSLATGTLEAVFNDPLMHWIGAIAFTRRGHLIAATAEDTAIRIWNLRDGSSFCLTGHRNAITALAFGPIPDKGPQRLVSSSRDRTVKWWNLNTGTLLHTQATAHVSRSLTLSPEGQFIAGSSRDRVVQVWDVQGRSHQTLYGYDCRVHAMALSPVGEVLALGDDTAAIRLCPLQRGRNQRTLKRHRNWVSALAYSPEGQWLASGSEDGVLYLWDGQTGSYRHTCAGHGGAIQSLCFHPNGTHLFSGCTEGVVKLWAIATLECQAEFKGHTAAIRALAMHPDGVLMASGSSDHQIRIWDLSTGQERQILCGHGAQVHTLCFWKGASRSKGEQSIKTNPGTGEASRPDSMERDIRLVSGSYDRSVRVWDLTTGACDRLWEGEADLIHAVTVTSDGRLYVSGNYQHQVTLWDLTATPICLDSLSHPEMIRWACFSAQGDRLITVQDNEIIRIWEISTQRCLHTVRTSTLYQGMNITGLKGCAASQQWTLKALGAVEE